MKRLWSRGLVLGVAALAVASVSIDCGRTFVVSNMGGTPISGAYVAYHHEGRTYAIVESVSYQASQLALLKSDASGRVVVPPAVHVHWPIIQSGADLTIDLIYAPTLHNGLAWVSHRTAVSRPREFEVTTDLATVRLEDVSGDPFLWQGTLDNLSSLLSRLISQPTRGDNTPRWTGELVDRFQGEYAAILDRYGETPRAMPNMPESVRWDTEQEKRAWQAMVDKDLAQRPRWGDELKRRFATEIGLYANRGTPRR
jgi:hypothetical protein